MDRSARDGDGYGMKWLDNADMELFEKENSGMS
jgi:hypothetical protein